MPPTAQAQSQTRRVARINRVLFAALRANASLEQIIAQFPDAELPIRLAASSIVATIGERLKLSPAIAGDGSSIEAPRESQAAPATLPRMWSAIAQLDAPALDRLAFALGMEAVMLSMACVSERSRPALLRPLGRKLRDQVEERLARVETRWPSEARRAVRGFFHSISTSRRGASLLRTVGRSLLAASFHRLRRPLRKTLLETSPGRRIAREHPPACLHDRWPTLVDELIRSQLAPLEQT